MEPSFSTVDAISKLKKGSLEALLLRAAGAGLVMVMYIVAARQLGTEGFGVFSYSLTIASLLAVVAPLGWPTALTRFAAEYVQSGKWRLLRGILTLSHAMTLAVSIVFGLIIFSLPLFLDLTPKMGHALKYSAPLLVFASFSMIRKRLFSGLQMVKASISLDEILLPLLVVAFMLILHIENSFSALRLYIAVSSCILVLGAVILARGLPRETFDSRPEYLGYFWLSIAVPMMFGGLNRLLLNRVDILMLGGMTDLSTVGLYSAASRIALVNIFLLTSINTIASPLLSASFHSGNIGGFRALMKRATIWSAGGTLPLFVILVLFPKFVLGLFGEGFEDGSTLLVVLAAGQFINAMTGPVGMALMMIGGERKFLFSMSTVTILNAAGNYIFIRSHGALGAAWVTAVCTAFLNVWQWTLVAGFIRKRAVKEPENSG